MIAVVKQSATEEQIADFVGWIHSKGLKTDVSKGDNETIIGLVGDTTQVDPFLIESMDIIERVVSRCVELKRDVVDEDEREGGIRQTLNLGHTIGHAIESANGYRLAHGSSVAAGMCFMARACARLGICGEATAQRVVEAVTTYGLPVTSDVPTDELFRHALSDKKRHGDTINVVTIHDIGHVAVEKVSLNRFREIIGLGRDAL